MIEFLAQAEAPPECPVMTCYTDARTASMIRIEFVICAALLVGAATLLTFRRRVGRNGLGRVWVGALLIVGVTSLPELASGITAVTVLNARICGRRGAGQLPIQHRTDRVHRLAYQPSILARRRKVTSCQAAGASCY
jgi:hypothetical protein